MMSQYGQVKESCSFLRCAKMVFWLHTARTGSPDTLHTHPSASDFHEYHSDTPRHPPDIPQPHPRDIQGTGHANRQQQMPIKTARHTQTAPVSVLGCLVVSVGVCWHLVFPRDIWGVSLVCLGCVWGYLSGNHGNQRRLDACGGYMGSQSLQYGAKTPFWQSAKRNTFFSPDHTETSKYQNRRISAFQK